MVEILISVIVSVVTMLSILQVIYKLSDESASYDDIKSLKGQIEELYTRNYKLIETNSELKSLIKQLANHQGIKITEINEFKKYKFEDKNGV